MRYERPFPAASVPSMTTSRSFLESFAQGVSRSILSARERCSTNSNVQPSPRSIPLAHGSTAPSRIVSDGSGMMRSGSISARVPRPWHSPHEPIGELNEKAWGASSPKLRPHEWQAFSSE